MWYIHSAKLCKFFKLNNITVLKSPLLAGFMLDGVAVSSYIRLMLLFTSFMFVTCPTYILEEKKHLKINPFIYNSHYMAIIFSNWYGTWTLQNVNNLINVLTIFLINALNQIFIHFPNQWIVERCTLNLFLLPTKQPTRIYILYQYVSHDIHVLDTYCDLLSTGFWASGVKSCIKCCASKSTFSQEEGQVFLLTYHTVQLYFILYIVSCEYCLGKISFFQIKLFIGSLFTYITFMAPTTLYHLKE